MERWKYMIIRIPTSTPDQEICALLDDYGNGGWEMISATENRFWLKRRIESEDDARR